MNNKEKSIRKEPLKETAIARRDRDDLAINKRDGFNFDFGYDRIQQTLALCQSIAQSGMVPNQYHNAPKKVLVASAMGARFGLDPLQSLQSIAVVNGSPTFYGDSLLGIVKNSSLEEWTIEGVKAMEYAMKQSEIYKKWIQHYEFKPSKIAFCVTKRVDEDPVIQHYTIDQAKEAGLLTKDNWKKNPVRMLQMRARSYAVRDAFPDVLKGYKTYEEMQDVDEVEYQEPLPDSVGDFVETEEWNDVHSEEESEIDDGKTPRTVEDVENEDEETEEPDQEFVTGHDQEDEDERPEEELEEEARPEDEPAPKDNAVSSLDMSAKDAVDQIQIIDKLSPLYAFVYEEMTSDEDTQRKTVLEAFWQREAELKEELSTDALSLQELNESMNEGQQGSFEGLNE